MLVLWGIMIHQPNKNLEPLLQGNFAPGTLCAQKRFIVLPQWPF